MKLPQRFGRFWLHQLIGRGETAEVFRATVGPDPDIYSFEVCVKRMHAHLLSSPRHAAMFRVEEYLASEKTVRKD